MEDGLPLEAVIVDADANEAVAATTPFARVLPRGADVGAEAGELAAALEDVAMGAALEESFAGVAPEGAMPHAVGMGLFPGSWSNGAVVPRSSGIALVVLHRVPAGLAITPGHVSVALSPVLQLSIMF